MLNAGSLLHQIQDQCILLDKTVHHHHYNGNKLKENVKLCKKYFSLEDFGGLTLHVWQQEGHLFWGTWPRDSKLQFQMEVSF